MTPVEHIEYFGYLHGMNGHSLSQRVRDLLELLDLKGLANRRVAGFSHGERTKVALARALVHQPHNIILDEPTQGLDVMSTRSVRDLVRKLRQDGCCVLFSSHIMQEVSALCDRIVMIAEGRVAADGTPDELRSLAGHDNLEEAFMTLCRLETEKTW
jgi:sodium transport system ATP-binding protein